MIFLLFFCFSSNSFRHFFHKERRAFHAAFVLFWLRPLFNSFFFRVILHFPEQKCSSLHFLRQLSGLPFHWAARFRFILLRELSWACHSSSSRYCMHEPARSHAAAIPAPTLPMPAADGAPRATMPPLPPPACWWKPDVHSADCHAMFTPDARAASMPAPCRSAPRDISPQMAILALSFRSFASIVSISLSVFAASFARRRPPAESSFTRRSPDGFIFFFRSDYFYRGFLWLMYFLLQLLDARWLPPGRLLLSAWLDFIFLRFSEPFRRRSFIGFFGCTLHFYFHA